MTLGHLSVKYRAERSLFGVEPSVLKSGMQKYMRRNDRERGVWCVIEMDLFSLAKVHAKELAAQEKASEEVILSREKSLRTNLINRLIVMISEEVNIHDACLPAVARELYQKWSAARDENSSRRYLLSFYLLLLNAKKCRIISDYKTIFNLPPYYMPDAKMRELVALHRAFLEKNDEALFRINYASATADALEKTIHLARAESDEALYWCGRLLAERSSAKRVAALWDALVSFGVAVESIGALRFFYQQMTHKEKPIYLYHALLLIVFRRKLDMTRREVTMLSESEASELYKKHVEEGALQIDAFIKDIHTGRRIKEGKFVFATEGALVDNEDKTFYSERHRKLYIEFKKVLDAHQQ